MKFSKKNDIRIVFNVDVIDPKICNIKKIVDFERTKNLLSKI